MFDKLERLFTDLVTIVKTRVEKLEGGFSGVKDDVSTLKSDLASARDDVSSLKDEIADMKKAAADLSGFQAAVDGLKGSTASAASEAKTDPVPQAEAPAPTSVNDLVALDVPEAHPDHIAAAVIAHDEAVAAGTAPDVAHADAVAAAAQAGAEPEVAVKIADSVATNPPSAETNLPLPAAEAAPVI